jgi:hypothetical protein
MAQMSALGRGVFWPATLTDDWSVAIASRATPIAVVALREPGNDSPCVQLLLSVTCTERCVDPVTVLSGGNESAHPEAGVPCGAELKLESLERVLCLAVSPNDAARPEHFEDWSKVRVSTVRQLRG